MLAVYFKRWLNMSDDESTVLFHIFVMLSYFMAVVGGAFSGILQIFALSSAAALRKI